MVFRRQGEIFWPIALRGYEIQAEFIRQEYDVQEDVPDWGDDEPVEEEPTEKGEGGRIGGEGCACHQDEGGFPRES